MWITILVLIGLLISIALNVFAGIFIYRLITKIDVYEKWIVDTRDNVQTTLKTMREIDKRGIFSTSVNEKGIFESDDLVGQIFKDLIQLLDTLNKKIK